MKILITKQDIINSIIELAVSITLGSLIFILLLILGVF
jgi:hypothetical protein